MGTPYTGGGGMPSSIVVLDDGDAPRADSIAPALEGLMDGVTDLDTVRRLVRQHYAGIGDASTWTAFMTHTGTTAWTTITDGGTFVAAIDPTFLLTGDVLDVRFHGHANVTTATTSIYVRLNVYFASTDHIITGGAQILSIGGTGRVWSFSAGGLYVMPSNQSVVTVKAEVKLTTSGDVVVFYPGCGLRIDHRRGPQP